MLEGVVQDGFFERVVGSAVVGVFSKKPGVGLSRGTRHLAEKQGRGGQEANGKKQRAKSNWPLKRCKKQVDANVVSDDICCCAA